MNSERFQWFLDADMPIGFYFLILSTLRWQGTSAHMQLFFIGLLYCSRAWSTRDWLVQDSTWSKAWTCASAIGRSWQARQPSSNDAKMAPGHIWAVWVYFNKSVWAVGETGLDQNLWPPSSFLGSWCCSILFQLKAANHEDRKTFRLSGRKYLMVLMCFEIIVFSNVN